LKFEEVLAILFQPCHRSADTAMLPTIIGLLLSLSSLLPSWCIIPSPQVLPFLLL